MKTAANHSTLDSSATNSQDPKLVALRFNECINNQDLNALALLMTDDHTFIDSKGNITRSKQEMIGAWKRFFEMFPKYRNTFHCVRSRENNVSILGFAYWSEKQPYDPALWTAAIVNDMVREWRVYADTEENRSRFDLL